MKVTIRRAKSGGYSAYVPKKDLECAIVSWEVEGLWGGAITLENGWRLVLPPLAPGTALPITVEAARAPG